MCVLFICVLFNTFICVVFNVTTNEIFAYTRTHDHYTKIVPLKLVLVFFMSPQECLFAYSHVNFHSNEKSDISHKVEIQRIRFLLFPPETFVCLVFANIV